MAQDYQELMKHLFRHMEIELPQECQNDVYTVAVDSKVTMKFFVAPAGYLSVIADLGELPRDASPALLLNMLNLNAFTSVHPQFNFKVGVAQQTRNVELWIREPLDRLEPDALIELFDCVVEMAAYVKEWMERPSPARKSASHTADILQKRHAAL